MCVFPAPCHHLPRTSDDSKMDCLEAYWLEIHTCARTRPHTRTHYLKLQFNWETQRFNTHSTPELQVVQDSFDQHVFLAIDTLRSCKQLLRNKLFTPGLCLASVYVCLHIYKRSWFTWAMWSVYQFPYLSLWHLAAASLHCKWNLVIALAAVTAHHVRAGDLLQPGLAEFEWLSVFILRSARGLSRPAG